MKKVLIIKNSPYEASRLLTNMLADHEIDFDIVDAYEDQAIPVQELHDGLIVLGGPDSAYDQTEKIQNQLGLIQYALKQQLPYLGICLGMQLLVQAAGGQSIKADEPEIGFTSSKDIQYLVKLTEQGMGDPISAGLPSEFPVFHLHYDTVRLTDDMALLGTGQGTHSQMVKVGNHAYGTQFHFELLPEVLELRAQHDSVLAPIGKEKLMSDFAAIQADYLLAGKTLLENFLKISRLV